MDGTPHQCWRKKKKEEGLLRVGAVKPSGHVMGVLELPQRGGGLKITEKRNNGRR